MIFALLAVIPLGILAWIFSAMAFFSLFVPLFSDKLALFFERVSRPFYNLACLCISTLKHF